MRCPILLVGVMGIAAAPRTGAGEPDAARRAAAWRDEGLAQAAAGAHDQALANLLAAYALVPSSRTLLEIASTLDAMGRFADAANTYQRYLAEHTRDPQRAATAAAQLATLDPRLVVLTVRVAAAGTTPSAEVSIDGGPFVPVATRLLTRVAPGRHVVRIRRGSDVTELVVEGVEGEARLLDAAPPGARMPVTSPGEPVIGWLTNGTWYETDQVTGPRRMTRRAPDGLPIPPLEPGTAAAAASSPAAVVVAAAPAPALGVGVLAVARIDGELRGFAGGVGLAVAHGRLEAQVLYLRAEVNGAYLGARYRFGRGALRPYVAAGIPVFLYEQPAMATPTTKLAIGVRVAGGVELAIDRRISVHADLGYERFAGVGESTYDAGVLVPSVGATGRL